MFNHLSAIIKTIFAVCLCLLCDAALAHPGDNAISHFSEGFSHPWLGLDHLAAMFAIGLWVRSVRYVSSWILPLGFWLAMLFGLLMPNSVIPLVVAEFAIVSTLALFGFCLILKKQPNLTAQLPVVVIAGISHGFVHTAEIQIGVNQSLPLLGLLMATALIHSMGIITGYYAKRFPFLQTITGLSCLLALVVAV